MVNHLAIHVADVERAVRAGGAEDGAEPGVGAGEEFAAGRGGRGLEGGAVGREHLALDEVLRGFADEGAVCEAGR